MPNWKDDKNVIVNSFFIIFFTLVILGVVWSRPNDGQTYQTFVSMLSGFGGALLMDMKSKVPPIVKEEKKEGEVNV